MNRKAVSALIGAGMLTTGLVAGTALAQSDAEGTTNSSASHLIERNPDDAGALAKLAEAGAPGLFVPISPYRSFDSREYDGAALGDLDYGYLDVTVDQENVPSIPATATAVAFNVTIADQSGSGFLTVFDAGQDPSIGALTSTINWSGAGSPIANGSTVRLNTYEGDPGHIGILVGGQGSRTDFIIDITGYYIAP